MTKNLKENMLKKERIISLSPFFFYQEGAYYPCWKSETGTGNTAGDGTSSDRDPRPRLFSDPSEQDEAGAGKLVHGEPTSERLTILRKVSAPGAP